MFGGVEVNPHRLEEWLGEFGPKPGLAGSEGKSVNHQVGAEAVVHGALGFAFQFVENPSGTNRVNASLFGGAIHDLIGYPHERVNVLHVLLYRVIEQARCQTKRSRIAGDDHRGSLFSNTVVQVFSVHLTRPITFSATGFSSSRSASGICDSERRASAL